MRIICTPVLLLLLLSPAGAAFGQEVETRPAENGSDPSLNNPGPNSELEQNPQQQPDPSTPSSNGAAADETAFPSMITMPDVREMKGGAGDPAADDPNAAGTQSPLPDYRIGTGDVLRVTVWREPEVSVDAVAVRSDGKITLPLIKEIYALGLTPAELEARLTRQFSNLINNPVVTVIPREINSQKVYTVGGVVRPGSITLRSQMTVLQVLAESGGLTDFAKRKKIYIIRREGGQESRIPFNYEAVLKGNDPAQNIPVRPGDTVVVPE